MQSNRETLSALQRRANVSVPREEMQTEVLNDAINDTFGDLVQKENLRVAGYPRIEPKVDNNDRTKLEYTATFEVYPDVVIGDLAQERVDKPIAEVAPEDVTRTIEILR